VPKITYVQPDGEEVTVEVPVGLTVMEGAIENDVDGIVAACGGSCSCSTCHVHVDEDWLEVVGPPHAAELDTLEFAIDVDERSRLSCQIEVSKELDGLIVHVAEEQA
jgi:2Fe-2S ferredoxin